MKLEKITIGIPPFTFTIDVGGIDISELLARLLSKPSSNKYYYIVAKHSGKCLDVYGANPDNAANVIQYEINHGYHQQWMPVKLPDSSYMFVVRHSHKVLDVQDYSKEDCGNVFQYQLHGDVNQRWELHRAGQGYYFIISKVSGKALDVQDGNKENAANIFQYELWKGDNQKWKFVPAS